MDKWTKKLSGKGTPGGTNPPRDGPSDDKVTEILRTRPEVGTLPGLDLGDYRHLLQHVTRPTEQQIRDFATYVAGARSWYRHLPLSPPGVPFYFFVDPCAGLDRILLRNGRAVYLNRTNESPRFHYSWMTTEEYRSRFGRLAFACAAGAEMFLPISCRLQNGREIDGVFANTPCRLSVHVTEEHEFRLPQEVLNAGAVGITAVVHRLTSVSGVLLFHIGKDAGPLSWPEETGGAAIAQQIMHRCRQIEAQRRQRAQGEGTGATDKTDEELDRLLAPERQRLLEAMVTAIRRVVELVCGAAA